MNRLTRLMYAGRGLHGHQFHSELRLRGWALLLKFHAFAPRAGTQREHLCLAQRLSGKRYHDHWLHNLLVSGSLLDVRQLTHGIRLSQQISNSSSTKFDVERNCLYAEGV
jgi:hypothetical protein